MKMTILAALVIASFNVLAQESAMTGQTGGDVNATIKGCDACETAAANKSERTTESKVEALAKKQGSGSNKKVNKIK